MTENMLETAHFDCNPIALKTCHPPQYRDHDMYVIAEDINVPAMSCHKLFFQLSVFTSCHHHKMNQGSSNIGMNLIQTPIKMEGSASHHFFLIAKI